MIPLIVENFLSNPTDFDDLVADFKVLGIEQVSAGLGSSEYPHHDEGAVQVIQQKLTALRTVKIDETIFYDGSDGDGVIILVSWQCLAYSTPDIQGCARSDIYYVNIEEMPYPECGNDYSYLNQKEGGCVISLSERWYLWHIWTQFIGT